MTPAEGEAPQAGAPPGRARRRGIFGWMLFDWANQPFYTLILTFIFAPYFAAEVIGDPVRGQTAWGNVTAIAGLIVAITAPFLGALADETGARKPWVAGFSVLYVAGCAGLWFAVPGMADTTLILLAFVLAYLGAEFTTIFTNAMLPDLGSRREIGRISGSGWAVGYLGGLAALIAVLVLMAPVPGAERTLIGIAPILGLDIAAGEPARATGPLAALWYLVFVLPLFLFTPDQPRRRLAGAVRRAGASLRDSARQVIGVPSLGAYLLASMLYRDGLAALFAFGGIYAAGILGWGLFDLGVFGILAAGTGAVGAWIGGQADRAFGPKPVILTAIWVLIAVCAVALGTTRSAILFVPIAPGSALPDLVFYLAGAALGAGAGSLQAASRTMLVHQAAGRVPSAQAFGLYALSGKITAFVGPALIAATTALTGSQQLGVTPVILLFLLGLVLLRWVDTGAETTGRPSG